MKEGLIIKKYNVAIVGATGVVGSVLLKVLSEYNFPINKLFLFASDKSVGKEIIYNNKVYFVEKLTDKSFVDVDFAFFTAKATISEKWCLIALKAGCIVIDNSSFYRMNKDVALIVPEINFSDFNDCSRLISNPNCSTIQCVLVLNCLKKYGLKKVNYTTFQAVSGSGMNGINDLELSRKNEKGNFYPYDISKTCIPQIDIFLDNGYTKEEMKMVNETRKILHLPNLCVSSTCVRVPVLYCHGVSVRVEIENTFDIDEVIEELKKQKSIIILDDTKNSIYPVSTVANNTDYVYVGRIRKDLCSSNSLLFYCVADNLRRGAASNAVLIALKIIENYK